MEGSINEDHSGAELETNPGDLTPRPKTDTLT